MAGLAGYDHTNSLIQSVGGVTIAPMSGGGHVGGANEIKDVKLFGKVYKLGDLTSFKDDASLDANPDIKEIMTKLRFATFPFLEKKNILQAIYNSNCSSETDLALDCGCDPVRKVIADLATILLEKTAAPGPIDVMKKASTNYVEISIRIPIDKIQVIMGKSAAPAAPAPAAPAPAAPAASVAPAASPVPPAASPVAPAAVTTPMKTMQNIEAEAAAAAAAAAAAPAPAAAAPWPNPPPTREEQATIDAAKRGDIGAFGGGGNTRKLRLVTN